MTPDENENLKKILTGAHDDFYKGLSARAFFKVNNKEISEDLVQDTFIKTWSYLVKGGKIDIMKAFLYHILNNLIIDQYRKHKTTSLDALIEKGFDPKTNEQGHIFDVIDGENAILLINQLPEMYKNIMKMRYIQDLTLLEISVITGQSKNSIAVQVHRGLDKLKILYNSNL